MQDFPDEIWSMIAHALLPRIPEPGAKVNWNDHLNQGAILPLQRVNKVSP
jgi:hypothetical protein